MCYRIPADAAKDVSKLSSSKKEESAFTPKVDIEGRAGSFSSGASSMSG